MKCPKCGYLGFERVDRCRNCGYEFSLTSPLPKSDFAIRPCETEAIHPMEDLALVDAARAWQARKPTPDIDLDRVFGRPEPRRPRAAPPPLSQAAFTEQPRPAQRGELPLFDPDDEPLITRASPPRPPLAVRRATPDVPRSRTEPRPRTLSFVAALDVADVSPAPGVSPAVQLTTDSHAMEEGFQDATVGARFLAVLVDLLILSVIDAVVVYFTMQLCYLTVEDLGILPKGPLVAFLLVQNGGYLVAFTAGGQTLGKMVAGIRVVQSDSAGPVDVGRAFLRTLMWVVLAVPAGFGFLTALFSRHHRGLHDRFAGTRVVRASAWG